MENREERSETKVNMHKMLLELPTMLETERIYMRPYQAGDGQMYFPLIASNKEHLRAAANERLLSFETEEDAEIYIRELAADWTSRERFVMAVWDKETQAFVCEIWIEPSDWDGPIFEIGWFADVAHLGQGFVTEAAKLALKWLFEDLHAHKVIVTTDDTNVKSYMVAERCGFIKEGCHRMRKKSRDGVWTSTLYYGMLKEDYMAANLS